MRQIELRQVCCANFYQIDWPRDYLVLKRPEVSRGIDTKYSQGVLGGLPFFRRSVLEGAENFPGRGLGSRKDFR